MAARVGKARLTVEMIDQVRPRAAEAELQQAGGEVREQRRTAERDGAARAAPVPDEPAQQDHDGPSRRAAADPAYPLHEGYEARAAFIDADRKAVRDLPVGGLCPSCAHRETEPDNCDEERRRDGGKA